MVDAPKIYITKTHKKELQEELELLTTIKRTEVAKDLESAKELGDLKENAEYHQAREDQAILEERIRVIQVHLKDGILIAEGHKTEVCIGATVTISKKGSSTKTKYSIVGSEESDPAAGKLAPDSPLVDAMIGKKEGEVFSFSTPSGEVVEYKVVALK